MEDSGHISDGSKNETLLPPSHSFSVVFLGSLLMDGLFPETMQPWAMAEIHRKKKCSQDVLFEVVEDVIRVCSKHSSPDEKLVLFEHRLHAVTRFAKLHQDPKCFGYLTKDSEGPEFLCHVYLAESDEIIPLIFQTLKEASREAYLRPSGSLSSGDSLASEGTDERSTKVLYEVKLVGRASTAGKKVNACDIYVMAEEMMEKTKEKEIQNQKDEQDDVFPPADDSLYEVKEEDEKKSEDEVFKPPASFCGPLSLAHSTDEQWFAADKSSGKGLAVASLSTLHTSPVTGEQLQKSPAQPNQPESSTSANTRAAVRRSGSSMVKFETSPVSGASNQNVLSQKEGEDQNMEDGSGRQSKDRQSQGCQDGFHHIPEKHGQVVVLQIGQQDMKLISLHQKVAVLECKFKDISSVSQGSNKPDIFGITVREADSSFICYILQCLTSTVVSEIMTSLQMAFTTAYNRRSSTTASSHPQQQQVCTACPLHQLYRISQEIQTMSSQSAYELLVKKAQQLPDFELMELNSHLQSEAPESYEESVEVMMIFLRQLCDRKQKDHVHVSENTKPIKPAVITLEDKQNKQFRGLTKAKKSLSASLENLLTRGKKKPETYTNSSLTTDSDTSWPSRDSSVTSTPDMSPMSKEFHHSFSSPAASPRPRRKRSATISSLSSSSYSDLQQPVRRRDVNHNNTSSVVKTVKVTSTKSFPPSNSSPSSSASTPNEDTTLLASPRRPSASWRKIIFDKVCTPQHSRDREEHQSCTKIHTADEIRAMWKKAILETLLLIRMEKENHSIRARQEEDGTALSRKLDYQELTPCLKEITAIWEKVLSLQDMERLLEAAEKDELSSAGKNIPDVELLDYVKKGVPRSLRGQIWLFVMQQHQMSGSMPDSSCGVMNYTDLLRQLTTHQHAILIDLGRTFPNHPYFSTSLGAGQLELFNLLKAYSLLDPEVGYCQGLSFIVGILLMHMEEVSTFHVLKYLMFDLGLRKQFRPNMIALQVKLYQLTRLLHDHYRDVYDHFEHYEISPSLYAAPWFLTLFASQFPLGFVARVFDMIFVQGITAILKVCLMLLGHHRALILQCNSFESIVDFLKITLPEMVQVQMERIINQAFELDIDKEIQAYDVEYQVFSEEMSHSRLRRQSHLRQPHTYHNPQDRGTDGSYRRVERHRRTSIDMEMLYRLEHQNRALKIQNEDLLEKLHQSHAQRDSVEDDLLSHQVERDKLRSHIQTLELERAALLSAMSKLQKLVPADTLLQLNLSPLEGPPSSSLISSPGPRQDQSQSEMSSSGVSSLNEGPINHTVLTSDASVAQDATVSPTKRDKNHISSNFESQIKNKLVEAVVPVTLSNAKHVSSTVGATPASSVLGSKSASHDSGGKMKPENKKSTREAPGAHVHSPMLATSSSMRQQYLGRSISNVASHQPGASSVSPEERRKAVKVVVQQKKNVSQSPNAPPR